MNRIEIPDELEVKFTAKEIGELRDYLSNTFIHSKVASIIGVLEARLIESYHSQPKQKEDDKEIS